MKKSERGQSTHKKIQTQGVPSKGSTNLKDLVFCHISQALLIKADTDHKNRTHVVAGGSRWLHTGPLFNPGTRWSAKPQDSSCLWCVRTEATDEGLECNHDSGGSHSALAVWTSDGNAGAPR